MLFAAEYFKSKGHKTTVFYNGGEPPECDINDCDCIIFPTPATKDGIHLFAPNHPLPVRLDFLLQKACGAKIFGALKTVDSINYSAVPYFKEKNSLLSAEAIIKTAAKNDINYFKGKKVLITGFGDFAKAIVSRLPKNTDVCVCARNPLALKSAKRLFADTENISNIGRIIGNYDIIFNTVPSTVINKEALLKVKPNAELYELASKPYGFDISAAKDLKLTVNIEPALPGRFFPKESGELIAKTVLNLI